MCTRRVSVIICGLDKVRGALETRARALLAWRNDETTNQLLCIAAAFARTHDYNNLYGLVSVYRSPGNNYYAPAFGDLLRRITNAPPF